jgi:hypothetical protein
VPSAIYGGILAATRRAGALDEYAVLLAKRTGSRFRRRHPATWPHAAPLVEETYRRELPARAEDVLLSIPRKARAEAQGARPPRAAPVAGPHLFADFYRLYLINKRARSPVRRQLLPSPADLYGQRHAAASRTASVLRRCSRCRAARSSPVLPGAEAGGTGWARTTPCNDC